MTNSYVISVKI